MTPEEYAAALEEITQLIKTDPRVDTPEGRRLLLLASLVNAHEMTEQTENNLVGGAASLLIRLLQNLGLSPAQGLAALDIAARSGRSRMDPEIGVMADTLATRIVATWEPS